MGEDRLCYDGGMLSHRHRLALIALSLFTVLFGGGPLRAAAKLGGFTGYQISDDRTSVTLTVDTVRNVSAENATGTLMLKLWARDQPYSSGTLGGHLLGSYKLDGLLAGRQYSNLKRTVPLTAPAKGNYAICLALVEYDPKANGYVVADWRNMPNRANLAPPKLFTMKAPFRWSTSKEGGTVEIEVASITHTRRGSTGGLRLSVWATDQPYQGGTLRGHQLGFVDKKPLAPGYSYTNVKNVAKYTPPPQGRYYVCIVLSEFGNDQQYSVVEWLGTDRPSDF